MRMQTFLMKDNGCKNIILYTKSDKKKFFPFFYDLDLKNIDTEQFDKGNVTEYVSKYEWVGDDESFKILKYSSQFILDTVSKSDYEKFNIAIYGKKKES